VTLLRELDASLREHCRCGELDADVEEVRPGVWRVWMRCTCGARVERGAEE